MGALPYPSHLRQLKTPALPTAEHIAEAARALTAGKLVAIPTETVYGLAADARNPLAVAKIFAAKGRPADHPLIVHLPNAAALSDWAKSVPESAQRLIDAFWPGPLTLVLRKADHVDHIITGGQDTIGVRWPAHPVAQALLSAFGGAVAAPSANRFGRISPTRAEHVHAEFPNSEILVLDGGPSAVGLESTIVDLSGDQPSLLRPGSVRVGQIEALIGPVLRPTDAQGPRASGRLLAHYAPGKPLILVGAADLKHRLAADQTGALWLSAGPLPSGAHGLALSDQAEAYARELYGALRSLDSQAGTQILVLSPPSDEHWAAVHDRLGRAAAGSGLGQ